MRYIVDFTGGFAYLSNSFEAPMVIEDNEFPSIQAALDAIGDMITDENYPDVLRVCIKAKFDQHPKLRQLLCALKDFEIVNTEGDDNENILGRILMEYRDKRIL